MWARIGALCIINPRNQLNDDTQVSFIPMPLICEGYANNHSSEHRIWKSVKSGFTHFAENDIGIAKITPCFENRKSVIFKNLDSGFGAGTTELHILRTLKNTVYPEYLLWIAKTDQFISGGVQTYTGAVGQQRVGKEYIANYLVPVPPREDQSKILAKIDTVFAMLSFVENEQVSLNEAIRNTKAKILNLAIRGQLVPQDPTDEPAAVLLERIRTEKEALIKQGKIKRDKKETIIFRGEDNSYYEKIGGKVVNIDDEIPFELPEGWEFIRLKEIWELISGRDLSPSEYNADGTGIPYITGASNFIDGKIELVRWTSSPQVITETGDLLFTCKGTVGEMAFNNFGSAHIARQIMAIRNIFALNSEYLALCMNFYINTIKNVAKGLIPGISREDILNLILPVPSPNYQERVVEKVVALTSILAAVELSLS